jgi:hypothetical protein
MLCLLLNQLHTPYFEDYIDKIIGAHQCGFQHNQMTTDQTFFIHQILEKRWEYNRTVHQLFIGFMKTYNSVSIIKHSH